MLLRIQRSISNKQRNKKTVSDTHLKISAHQEHYYKNKVTKHRLENNTFNRNNWQKILF